MHRAAGSGWDEYLALTANLDYSWVWGGHNVSAVAEYFFNGFGQNADDYDPSSLAGNTDLIFNRSGMQEVPAGFEECAGGLHFGRGQGDALSTCALSRRLDIPERNARENYSKAI